ncbi:hypothetical protein [Pseudodesulfovibrio sp. zrk46]|uniref:F0F1 ATP synthase subunit B family protein n=1 Tax=Pseudodesulfovibrio sp. zrk46 TaxID=2725288 RepID=UPI001448AF5B|nr:hypothetical protein [Pseudodesulfovibrio sp. zrk46]QJB57561.1 hypothetical protein HFN16_14595 [Pseudodesulfovibrio sp. zrk46]
MLIDWFTVIAQGINFLILAWLLKRFLYGPIIEGMKKRQQQLANEHAAAEAMRTEAELREQELSLKHDELMQKSEAMLTQMRNDVEQERINLLNETKKEIKTRHLEWQKALEHEQAKLSELLRARMAEKIIQTTNKVLRDLADEDLNSIAILRFFNSLPNSSRISDICGPVTIRTGFPLYEEAIARIKERLFNLNPKSAEVKTTVDTTLGFGITMLVGDVKWEWNLISYLDEMERAIFEELPKTKAEL